MKEKNIRLTDRDVAILQFINRFGICEVPQLCRHFKLSRPYNYELMERLVKSGLVRHTMVYHQRPGIYWLTPSGAKYTYLPPLKKIPSNAYRHAVLLIDLYFELMHRYPGVSWVSERELVWDKYHRGVGQKGHNADGMMVWPDGKKMMIELELSLKGYHRTERILKQYGTQLDIQEVWYFCSDQVAPTLNELASNKPYIKIKLIKEYVDAESRRFRFLG